MSEPISDERYILGIELAYKADAARTRLIQAKELGLRFHERAIMLDDHPIYGRNVRESARRYGIANQAGLEFKAFDIAVNALIGRNAPVEQA